MRNGARANATSTLRTEGSKTKKERERASKLRPAQHSPRQQTAEWTDGIIVGRSRSRNLPPGRREGQREGEGGDRRRRRRRNGLGCVRSWRGGDERKGGGGAVAFPAWPTRRRTTTRWPDRDTAPN
jgi:hypothetical protein